MLENAFAHYKMAHFFVYKIKSKTALETHQSGNHFDLINPRKALILSHFRGKKKRTVIVSTSRSYLAQKEGFEPSCDCSQTDFELLESLFR